MPIVDNYGRTFPYLRLSITDVCNFRCGYCLPNGYHGCQRNFLSVTELRRLVQAFSELGVRKIRLTGGEPTLRKDFIEIVKMITDISGINKIAFTTNGYKLRYFAAKYFQAGLSTINISVDSLNPKKFFEITGHDKLDEILEGIKISQAAGFTEIKINIVLLKGLNDDELEHYLDWVNKEPIRVRFIELMQTGTNKAYFQKYHMPVDIIRQRLVTMGWQPIARKVDAGPAIEYVHDQYKGRIGFIAPYSKDFCASCNRLRVSAKGNLHLCLFTDVGYSLRPLLQRDSQIRLLKQVIQEKMQFKKASHFLHEGKTGINDQFSLIGG